MRLPSGCRHGDAMGQSGNVSTKGVCWNESCNAQKVSIWIMSMLLFCIGKKTSISSYQIKYSRSMTEDGGLSDNGDVKRGR